MVTFTFSFSTARPRLKRKFKATYLVSFRIRSMHFLFFYLPFSRSSEEWSR